MIEQDDELQKLEEEAKALGINPDDIKEYGSPEPEKKDNIFRFFRDLLNKTDPTRIGNLNDQELGRAIKPVRNLLHISSYADVENLPTVGKYIRQKAWDITATSMSRKGWFVNTSVTQIKREQKTQPALEQKKWTLFGAGAKKQEAEENV